VVIKVAIVMSFVSTYLDLKRKIK